MSKDFHGDVYNILCYECMLCYPLHIAHVKVKLCIHLLFHATNFSHAFVFTAVLQ